MKSKAIITFVIFSISIIIGQSSHLRKCVFLAHSTGTRIWGPNESSTNVPDEVIKYNNNHNLTGDDEFDIVKEDWPANPWTNEWVRWHQIFNGEDSTADIQPYLDNYEIVIIKSCFPSSGIPYLGTPEDTLVPERKSVYNYKWHWRNFIKKMESYPKRFFVVWTNAPLAAKSTDDNEAFLSDQFCRWAKDTLANSLDPEYGIFPKNVYVFDFFHKLAGTDGKLPIEYSLDSTDSHPNSSATELVAPQLVQEVFDAVIQYERLLPVELENFSFSIYKDKVQLKWETITETNNFGFEIERKVMDKTMQNPLWHKIGFVPGSGNSNIPLKYNFLDNNLHDGKTFYRLKQIDNDGTYKYSPIISVEYYLKLEYSLRQNYPNPFNPNTIIEYTIPEDSHVKIVLYDLLGAEIKTLKDEYVQAGHYKLDVNFNNLASGIYLYEMKTNNFKQSKKLIYLK